MLKLLRAKLFGEKIIRKRGLKERRTRDSDVMIECDDITNCEPLQPW